jgi:hypothetical protein
MSPQKRGPFTAEPSEPEVQADPQPETAEPKTNGVREEHRTEDSFLFPSNSRLEGASWETGFALPTR